MEFVKEKIIVLILLSKDLVSTSYISIPNLLIRQFWNGFRECLLEKKALPLQTPEITFTCLPYNFRDLDDDKTCSIRIVTRSLRNKSRGRRSNQFKVEQLQQLSDCEAIYKNVLQKEIEKSNIFNALHYNI